MENRLEAQSKTTHFHWILDLITLTKHSDAFPITGLELGVIVSIKCGPLWRILHLQLDSWFKKSNSSVIERAIELHLLLHHVFKQWKIKSKRNDNLLANAHLQARLRLNKPHLLEKFTDRAAISSHNKAYSLKELAGNREFNISSYLDVK